MKDITKRGDKIVTCIVGLVEGGVTYIGADSIGSNSYTKTIRKDKKVFKLKDTDKAIIGFTSSFRMGQLLMYANNLLDKRDEDKIDHEYLVTKFVPEVIQLFEKGGFSRNESGEKSGGSFLLGFKDRLYSIDGDFQVGENALNYDACGSGEEFAKGSLHSTNGFNLPPEQRVRKALQAASEFSLYVGGPFYVLNTKTDEVTRFDQ
jgi:ATP-dependent protease HslVU (ClpYQ) peptidase subunit